MLGEGGLTLSIEHLLKRKIGFVSVPAEYEHTLAAGSKLKPPLTKRTCFSGGIRQALSMTSLRLATLNLKKSSIREAFYQ